MAKNKAFGEAAEKKAGDQGKRVKVVISTKLDNNKYAFKEKMVPQDEARDYIKEKQG